MSEEKPSLKIVDLSDVVAKGYTVKLGTDLFVGPVTSPAQAVDAWPYLREPELWTQEPPQGTDGKIPMQFQITERCGAKEKGKPACRMNLIVTRIKDTVFETDENQGGGQLKYDEKNITQWKYCPKHGPFGGPWEKVGNRWVRKAILKVTA